MTNSFLHTNIFIIIVASLVVQFIVSLRLLRRQTSTGNFRKKLLSLNLFERTPVTETNAPEQGVYYYKSLDIPDQSDDDQILKQHSFLTSKLYKVQLTHIIEVKFLKQNKENLLNIR